MSLQIKERLAHPGNYGSSRGAGQIKYLVLLYTGDDGDTAAGNVSYYPGTVAGASSHCFMDNQEIFRSVPELTVAWAVGGKKWVDCGQTGGGTLYRTVTNTNSISVEFCNARMDGVYGASEETLARAVAL